jgi:hypothetical protein
VCVCVRACVRSYFVNCEKTRDVSAVCLDRAVGRKLWDMSERAVAQGARAAHQ